MSLVDKNFIKTHLTVADPWSASHGSAADSEDLSAGILYYALAYSLRATTCVCLGSGGGFVPRMMRQAQRDLDLGDSRTILIDGGRRGSRRAQEDLGLAFLAGGRLCVPPKLSGRVDHSRSDAEGL